MRIELSYGCQFVGDELLSSGETGRRPEWYAGQEDTSGHRSVMRQEAVQLLAPRAGQSVVDCTVGMGGHSLAILPHLMPAGQLIAMDCDEQALAQAHKRLAEFDPHIQFVHDNFRQLPESLSQLGLPRVHGVIADLGVSSVHVDTAERGFSFLRDGPLDMRMDQRQQVTAASLVSRLSEWELAKLLEHSGEERWARRIARKIVEVRRVHPIRTTTQLARIVAEAVPHHGSSRRIHPATKTFLALRIAVNEELTALERLLAALPEVLLPGGRAVVISFHSLEDRMVKRAFQQGARDGVFRIVTKKPLVPSEEEVVNNPRARSAKLRAVERLP